MKIIFFSLIISLLYGDEIQRMEMIVSDIAKLRISYETCKDELKSVKSSKLTNLYKPEKTTDIKNENYILNQKVVKLTKQLLNIQNILKIKDREIISLRNKINHKRTKKVKIKENKALSLENICKKVYVEDDNPFPTLIMKDKYKTQKMKITTYKASSFRTKHVSSIYAYPDAKKIEQWEGGKSFTSNKKTSKWIKITGFFINKQWQKVSHDMWIKNSDVVKR